VAALVCVDNRPIAARRGLIYGWFARLEPNRLRIELGATAQLRLQLRAAAGIRFGNYGQRGVPIVPIPIIKQTPRDHFGYGSPAVLHQGRFVVLPHLGRRGVDEVYCVAMRTPGINLYLFRARIYRSAANNRVSVETDGHV